MGTSGGGVDMLHSIDSQNIRYTYNSNYMYRDISKIRGKHLRGSDLLDKSKDYTTTLIRCKDNANYDYIVVDNDDNKERVKLANVISKLKYATRNSDSTITFKVNNNYLIVVVDGVVSTYKIYQTNKLNKKRVDYTLKNRLYNK